VDIRWNRRACSSSSNLFSSTGAVSTKASTPNCIVLSRAGGTQTYKCRRGTTKLRVSAKRVNVERFFSRAPTYQPGCVGVISREAVCRGRRPSPLYGSYSRLIAHARAKVQLVIATVHLGLTKMRRMNEVLADHADYTTRARSCGSQPSARNRCLAGGIANLFSR